MTNEDGKLVISNTNLEVTKFTDYELDCAKSFAASKEQQSIRNILARKQQNLNLPYMEDVK
jgi:hypothetical protein